MLPSCWSSLVASAAEWREVNMEDLEVFLEEISSDRGVITGLTEDQNSPECAAAPTQKVFAAFWEFLTRCQQSLIVHLSYPSHGWIILGPPYVNAFDNIDEVQFTKEVNTLLDALLDQGLVKRDMLCYIMKIFSQFVREATEYCRNTPALARIFRYQIANHFGPILFTIKCERCKTAIYEKNRSCEYCSTVSGLLQRPFVVDIMDRLLCHFTTEFWANALLVVQKTPGNVPSDPEKTHADILSIFYKKKPPTKNKPRASTRPSQSLLLPQATPLPSNLSTTKNRSSMGLANTQNPNTNPTDALFHRRSTAPNIAGIPGSEATSTMKTDERQSVATTNTTTSGEGNSGEYPWGVSQPKKTSVRKAKQKPSQRRRSGTKVVAQGRKPTARHMHQKQRQGRKQALSKKHTPRRRATSRAR